MIPIFIHPSDNFERPSRPTPANGVRCPCGCVPVCRTPHRCIANGAYLGEVHACDCLAADQKSAVRVGDGERIAAITIACQEVPFEIHAPKLIGRSHHRERLRTRRGAPFLPLRVGEPGPAEDLTHRTCRRPAHVGVHALQSRLELPRSPGRELASVARGPRSRSLPMLRMGNCAECASDRAGLQAQLSS